MILFLFLLCVFVSAIKLYMNLYHKKHNLKVSLILDVSMIFILITLIFLKLITFRFNFYLLTLYLVFSLGYQIYISFKPFHQKEIRNLSLTIVKKLLLILFIFLPLFIFPFLDPIQSTGSFQVEKLSLTYTDLNRDETFTNDYLNRMFNLDIYYPSDSSKSYPLIIFSHGGISTKTSNLSLFLELASHGYVIISIDHTFHSIQSKINQKNYWIDATYFKELNQEDAMKDKTNSLQLYQKWMELRTDDIKSVIDYIELQKEIQLNPLYQIMDLSNIGVMGHSLGGSAAMCVGNIDDRIKAVMALESPMFCSIVGIEDDKFKLDDTPYQKPLFQIYSDSVFDRLKDLPQYGKNDAILNTDQVALSHLHISGSGHFSLTDLSRVSPILTRLLNGFKTSKSDEEILEIINQATLDFFDTYLKNA